MPKSVFRPTSRILSTVTACALAAGMTLSTATPARATDPVVWWVVGGLVTLGILAHGTRTAHAPTHTVIARYCENPKTGLYHKC